MKRCTKIFVLCLAVVVSRTEAGTAQSDKKIELIKHKNPSGQYEALMPNGVSISEVEGKSIIDTQHSSSVIVEGCVFSVHTVGIAPFLIEDKKLRQQTHDAYMALKREEYIKKVGTPTTERVVNQHGMSGKDYYFRLKMKNGAPVEVRRRVMFDGVRLFEATVLGTPQTVSSATADRFLNSFGPLGKVKTSSSPVKTQGVSNSQTLNRPVRGY